MMTRGSITARSASMSNVEGDSLVNVQERNTIRIWPHGWRSFGRD
jgi:hypothetical protein